MKLRLVLHHRELLHIEFIKVKRSKIVPLIFIAPLLVVITGIMQLSRYFTAGYTNVWGAMFVQSALVFAYYLLPFSMIVVCVLIAGRETGNNGILKMLTLPVNRCALSMAKFCVLTFYLFMETVIFFLVFLIAGQFAVQQAGLQESIPLFYLLKCCGEIFLTMLPCVSFMWVLTVLSPNPMLSIGLNLLFVVPGVLVANTPLWVVYPYCYSGYLISSFLRDFTEGADSFSFSVFPFVPLATVIFSLMLFWAATGFGKKEMM